MVYKSCIEADVFTEQCGSLSVRGLRQDLPVRHLEESQHLSQLAVLTSRQRLQS